MRQYEGENLDTDMKNKHNKGKPDAFFDTGQTDKSEEKEKGNRANESGKGQVHFI